MRFLNRVSAASLAVLFFAGFAAAQSKPKPSRPTAPNVPLKVSVVLSEYAGAKKISSLPYTLAVNATPLGSPWGAPARLRMGVTVPIETSSPKTPSHVQYQNLGANIDCSARAYRGGAYQVSVSVSYSSIYLAGAKGETGSSTQFEATTSLPTIRHFSADNTLILRDGQTGESTVASDPVTGHQLRVLVTLHVVKSAP